MTIADQNINPSRYQVIPRVLIFVMRADAVLLIKLLPKKGKVTGWTGRFNGPGGHIEQGENILDTGTRELKEETGISADLFLCGYISVDTGQIPGIGLFILRGDNPQGELESSDEGLPQWVTFESLDKYPLVEDVSLILNRIRKMKIGDQPFVGRSYYDTNGKLVVEFT